MDTLCDAMFRWAIAESDDWTGSDDSPVPISVLVEIEAPGKWADYDHQLWEYQEDGYDGDPPAPGWYIAQLSRQGTPRWNLYGSEAEARLFYGALEATHNRVTDSLDYGGKQ